MKGERKGGTRERKRRERITRRSKRGREEREGKGLNTNIKEGKPELCNEWEALSGLTRGKDRRGKEERNQRGKSESQR